MDADEWKGETDGTMKCICTEFFCVAPRYCVRHGGKRGGEEKRGEQR